MGNIERDPDDFDLTDEQLEAMRGREDPEVAAVLPEPREVSEAERLRRQLAGAVGALEILERGLDGSGGLPFGARANLHSVARMALKRLGGQ